jgi:hypothetical protein
MREIKLRLDDTPIPEEKIGSVVRVGSPVAPVAGQPIDMTRLVDYSRKISQIGQALNKSLAPIFIQDFSIAYDITSNMLYEAIRQDLTADTKLKVAESIAYLENAKEFLTARDIKDTSEARKQYVPLDPEVQTAAEVKAKTTAMVSFLKSKLTEFKGAIESVKNIAYGDSFMSHEEGM